MRAATALALAATLLLAACGGDVRRYIVEPGATSTRLDAIEGVIGVREVSLPDYAGGDEILVRGTDGALAGSSDHLWADEPADALTRGLAVSLDDISPNDVVSEPWPREIAPMLVVEVVFDELLGEIGGAISASGQYRVLYADRRISPIIERFEIARDGPPFAAGGRSVDYQAVAAAHGAVIADLSEIIARRIAERRRGGS